jgi:hypothetical protein
MSKSNEARHWISGQTDKWDAVDNAYGHKSCTSWHYETLSDFASGTANG